MTGATDALRSLYSAFADGDGDALGRLIGDTHWVEASGGPYGGVYNGLGEVVENVFGPIGRDVRNFTAIPDEILPVGDDRAIGSASTAERPMPGRWRHVSPTLLPSAAAGLLVSSNSPTRTSGKRPCAEHERR